MLGSSALITLVGVSDMARARAFYEGVLGLRVVEANSFAVVVDAHGSMLRLTAVETPAAAPYAVLGWQVADVDAAVDALVAVGVVFTIYDGMDQDPRGIWTSPGGGRIAWFPDPDANVLSLAQI